MLQAQFVNRFDNRYKPFQLSIFFAVIVACIGQFVFSGWSDVNLRYKNYYGYSFFVGGFGSILDYIAFMLAFIAGCNIADKKQPIATRRF